MASAEIRLEDLVGVLLRYKKSIIGIIVSITITMTLIGYFLPRRYISQITLIPEEGQGKVGIGSLFQGGMLSGAGLLGGGSSDEVSYYRAVIQSKRFFSAVVKRVGLEKFYEDRRVWDAKNQKWVLKEGENPPTLGQTVGNFISGIKLTHDGAKNVVTISYEAADPYLAFEVTKAISVELYNFINQRGYIEAQWKRLFLENQVKQVQKSFLEIGKELSAYYEKKQISPLTSEIDVELGRLALVQTMNNSSLDRETRTDAVESHEEDFIAVEKVPEHVYLEYLTTKKELLMRIVGVLMENYEVAKFEVNQKRLAFHILDEPELVLSPYKPQVRPFFMFSLVGSSVLAVFLAFVREYLKSLDFTVLKRLT